jgi:prepilin-type N-terminal cleavage/methylation domain-containing protein
MRKNGFTVVEAMVVVMIFGILAVMFVPKLTFTRQKNRPAALSNNLQKVRAQIELYKFHHKGDLPASKGESPAQFVRRMTKTTNVKGDRGTEFGPYLDSMPTNPVNGKQTVRIDGDAAGVNTHGWRFDTTTGDFQSDDSVENAAL